MAKNTKHVGLLLFAFVKLFLFYFLFTSFLEKVASAGIKAWERDAECPLVSRQPPKAGAGPQAAQTSRSGYSGSGAGGEPRVRSASGRGFPSRLIVLTLGSSPPPAAFLRFTTPTPRGPRLLPSPELSPAL